MPSIGEKLGLISAAETAVRLRISTDTLNRLARQGRVPFVQTPLGRLYSDVEITEFAKTFQRPRPGRPPSSRRRKRRGGAQAGPESTG